MKNLWKNSAFSFPLREGGGRGIFRSNISELVSGLDAANDGNDSAPILSAESLEGMSVARDTSANFEARISQVTNQGADAAGGQMLEGNRYHWNIEAFRGFQANLYDPVFWFLGRNVWSPKGVTIDLMERGFEKIGGLEGLFGESPRLSDKLSKTLLSESVIKKTLRYMHQSGGSHLPEISQTSVREMRSVVTNLHQLIQEVNLEQIRDLDKSEEEVFWKEWLRSPFFQKTLYQKKIRRIQSREQAGYEEIIAILQSMEQIKEQAVFAAKQSLDQVWIPAKESGDTVKIAQIQRLIHRIMNHPEAFINSPETFNSGVLPATEVFGEKFIPLDVLEMLKGSKYEYMEGENPDYLDSAIAANEAHMSHYNQMRNLTRAQQRIEAVKKFDSVSLEKLEQHVNQTYDPDGNAMDLENPELFVDEVIMNLGAATPGLVRDLHEILKSGEVNIYTVSTEIFWHLAGFFGENLAAFDRLHPPLQQQFAQFFLSQRSKLEESVISGGVEEKGTVIWRVRALNQGKIVLNDFSDLAESLPDLHMQMRSLETGVAQEALLKIKTVLDNYGLFKKFLGVNDVNDLEGILGNFPEFEASILQNVLHLESLIEEFSSIYETLGQNRKDFEAMIDQNRDIVDQRLQEYNEKKASFNDAVGAGKTGFEDTKVSTMFGFPAGESAEAEAAAESAASGGGAFAGLETVYTAIRNDLNRLDDFLTKGEDGGAVGKLAKLDNATFAGIPGNMKDSIHNITDITGKMLERRLNELGIQSDDDVNNLVTNKPSLDLLARMELGKIVSEDILKDFAALSQHNVSEQFSLSERSKEIPMRNIIYAPARNQKRITAANLMNPETLENLLYVKTDDKGFRWYHTDTQVVKIGQPHLNSDDQRNLAVWNKPLQYRGLGRFYVPTTQPDMLGVYLSGDPESFADGNEIFGNLESVSKEEEVFSKTSRNYGSDRPAANDLVYALTA